jgi:hypothetical protein
VTRRRRISAARWRHRAAARAFMDPMHTTGSIIIS